MGLGSSPRSATTYNTSALVSRDLQFSVEKGSREGGCGVQTGNTGEPRGWRAVPHRRVLMFPGPAGQGHGGRVLCACAGAVHNTHQRVLALPPRPPHLPGSCAGLLPLLLATCLLLLLSLLWAQTQPVRPGPDPTGLHPAPTPQPPHSLAGPWPSPWQG